MYAEICKDDYGIARGGVREFVQYIGFLGVKTEGGGQLVN